MSRVGVIVGRFQVPFLTQGHWSLIDQVTKEFDHTIIFIGTTKDGSLSYHDPLPFEAREAAIVDKFPELAGHIFEIPDIGNWELWVKDLDRRISCAEVLGIIPYTKDTFICGSRDSIISRYKESGGTYETFEVQEYGNAISGTAARKEVVDAFVPTWDNYSRSLLIWISGKNEGK